MRKKFLKLNSFLLSAICYLLSAALFGCAAAPRYNAAVPSPPVAQAQAPGVYHRVEKGQTLWRIARAYNMDMEQLARLNHIPYASSIEVGQLLLIPGRQARQALTAIYPDDDFIWPLKGRVISFFGQPCSSMVNKGINIEPYADPRVLAARSGRVAFYSDNFAGYGRTVIIDHGDGLFTVYARNKEVFVKPGDSVLKGSVIASAGSAGRDKNEYLHFEVRQGHVSRNPLFYLPR